ncbi:MAG: RNA-directed DNA polymerase [Chlamydiae bacterium]|nr:RNA-directed DNA polymerase [Chlamydiota bacterium]
MRAVRDFKYTIRYRQVSAGIFFLGGFIHQQLSLFDHIRAPDGEYPPETAPIRLEDLFEAYSSCRSNKRSTSNALAYEIEYERHLVELWEEINNGSYLPGKSIAFTVSRPVKREIFAAEFKDRIVHHLIINKLNPLFEKTFIYDSYACRVGKGTSFGIKRLDRFIRKCSENYTKDCYVLKLDVQGFFMHIDRIRLFERLKSFVEERYKDTDRQALLTLCKKIIHNDPAKNCIIKGKVSDWDDLPRDKSLFHSPENCGLPIGNLTSQVFANFYMNPFDHYMKKELGIKYYGRYVDDFVVVHHDKEYLKELIPKVRGFLDEELKLKLHPKKIYLQHYGKGVSFLGAFIKPNRIYVNHRSVRNFREAIQRQNAIIEEDPPTVEEKQHFLSSMNSYLGMMLPYKSYTLRKKILSTLSKQWWKYASVTINATKWGLRS